MGAPGATAGYTALGLFLILTAFLSVQSLERSGGRFGVIPRVQRVILPWLFWCLFYKAALVIVSDTPVPIVDLSSPTWLLIGPVIHLWFLPFIILVALLVPVARRLITDGDRLIVAAGGAAVVSILVLALHSFADMPEPFPQWTFALPPFLYGLLSGHGHRLGLMWPPVAFGLIVYGAIFAMTQALWAVESFLALVLFEIFWRMPLRGEAFRQLGQLAFGIYLLHPFFMLVVYKVAGPAAPVVPAALATFALSAAATYVLRRTPGLCLVI